MVYNFPVVTAGQDLDSDVIGALAAHPNIVGTKLSCGNVGKLHRLTGTPPARAGAFAVFAGKSDVCLHGLLSGGAGCIAALVNVCPKAHVRLFALWRDGAVAEAMELQARLGRGDWALAKVGGIGGIKALVSREFGYGGAQVRGPLKVAHADNFGPEADALMELIALEKSL
jgi:4-hydroxy-2-oxoglutarate aldolase